MAIEALGVNNTDMEIRGGLQYVAITTWADASSVTFDDSDDHAISAVAGISDAKLFDLKLGTGSLTTAGTKEGGTIALESMKDTNLAVFVKDHSGQAYCVGYHKAFALEDDYANQQVVCRLSSIEGGTGAALGDEHGVTVTITCVAHEMPRAFSGTFTPDSSAGTVTIS